MLLFPLAVSAQHIKGHVQDSKTKEDLIGAIVEIDAQHRAVTDENGLFTIAVAAGKANTIYIRYVGYKPRQISGLKAGEETIEVTLDPDETQLEGVSVTAVAMKNTVNASILEVKNSNVIQSNVSAQEIARTQDSNAGEVIRRIPGVSLIEDKYVIVRGLSQRYNNVWINGGAVASTDADTRAFSFDILPSQQIDNLTIIKVPSAEFPADYTGGFIRVSTKEIPAQNGFSLQLGGNWNTGTAFQDFYYSKASGTDFLGFDSGMRSWTGGFDRQFAPVNGDNSVSLSGNGFNNDWRVKKRTPVGDLKLTASYNHAWYISGRQLGLIGVLNYTNEQRTITGMENNVYGVYDVEHDQKNYLQQKLDNQYNQNSRLGAMLNLTLLSKDGHHKYQLKNIFNQLGNARYTQRDGHDVNYHYDAAEYYYRSRTTYNGQIAGSHNFSGDALDWSVGYAYANRHLPDRRHYQRLADPTSSDFEWQNGNDVSREWTRLEEHIFSAGVNNRKDFHFTHFNPSLKAGAYYEYRTRKYDVRDFWYAWDPMNFSLSRDVFRQDLSEVLSNADNFGADKFYMLEHVDWTNRYEGDNTIAAGYITAVLPLGKFSAEAGVRYEHKDMELRLNQRAYEKSLQSRHYRSNDFFPTVNMLYKLNDKHQLRLAYGRSVNRPEFREVSPSSFYDFDLNATIHGNADLKDCFVDNIDLRYEWYPAQGEMISIAGFYKHFKNPIEWTYTVTSEAYDYSFDNANSANNFGLELDIKKSLDFLGLPDFSLAFNGSLIHSRVKFPAGSRQKDRAMQGQSPYLVNTGVFYNNKQLGLQMALLYNRIGKRIVGVGRTVGAISDTGNNRVPDSYEMPRDVFDFTASKRFGDHWELKFAARDILNAKVQNKQFSDITYADGQTRRVTQLAKSFRPGTNLGLSVVWKL